eukprot:scaffold72985_cov52-Attheya_sp.AAC.1
MSMQLPKDTSSVGGSAVFSVSRGNQTKIILRQNESVSLPYQMILPKEHTGTSQEGSPPTVMPLSSLGPLRLVMIHRSWVKISRCGEGAHIYLLHTPRHTYH